MAAYWGIQTLRAVENFPITGTTISAYPQLVRALAQVKHAAVLANFHLSLIDEAKKEAIVRACPDIGEGRLLTHLTAACTTLADHCVAGITANREYLRSQIEASIGVVTILNPLIGYDAATSIARQALSTGRSITSLVLERGLLTADELEGILRPEHLANPQAHTAPVPTNS